MNLKEEIDKTNDLKNDLKLAKNKINDRILSGGGTKANTISEVPGKIDEMLGNYKKVATIKLNIKTEVYVTTWRNIHVPYSLNFQPSRIILKLKINCDRNLPDYERLSVDSKFNYDENTKASIKPSSRGIAGDDHTEVDCYITNKQKNGFNFFTFTTDRRKDLILEEITAIE